MSEAEKVWIDAIALKREAAERIYEETKDMTREEELAYWSEKSDRLAARIAALKAETAGEAKPADSTGQGPATKDKLTA